MRDSPQLDHMLGELGEDVEMTREGTRLGVSNGLDLAGEVVEQRDVVLIGDELDVEVDVFGE